MRHAREPLVHAVNEGYRAPDLSQRPRHKRQIDHGRNAGVLPEAKGKIIVPAGLEQSDRAFQFTHGLDIFAGEVVSRALDPVRDTGLGRIGSRRNASEEGRSMRSHRRKIAPHVAADPQAVISRQPLWRILVPGSRFAGSSEGLHCFRRPMASRRDERVAIGRLQLRHS
jgi:hypothetical protein